MGMNCLAGGCHHTVDHKAVDDCTAEIDFDILWDGTLNAAYFTPRNYVFGDPILNKNVTTGIIEELPGSIQGCGDGTRDRVANDTLDTGDATPVGDGLAEATPMTCESFYCHSRVQKVDITASPAAQIWPTAAAITWDATVAECGSCHGDETSNGGLSRHMGNKMNTSSHSTHAGTYGFDCQECHNGFGKTDDGTDPEGSAVINFYPSHVNGKVEINISTTAGAIVVGGTYTTAYSVAASDPNTNLPGIPYPSIGNDPGTSRPNDGRSGSCDSVYCHSDGAETKEGIAVSVYQQPFWGQSTALGCTGCHGSAAVPPNAELSVDGEPNYDSSGPGLASANSHYGHVVNFGLQCKICHATTLEDTPTGNTINVAGGQHINGTMTVAAFDTANYGADFGGYDVTADGTEKRCFDSCHGEFDPVLEHDDAPQWGGAGGGGSCLMCHDGTEQAIRPEGPTDGLAEKIDAADYILTGHGLDEGLDYTSLNSGAGFMWVDTYTVGSEPGCVTTSGEPTTPTSGCHSFAAAGAGGYGAHWTEKIAGSLVGDVFYLGINFKWNMDNLCVSLNCHSTTSPYPAADTHTKSTTGSELDWDANSTKLWQTNPPKCVDCHDPHGDANDYMVKYAVSSLASGSLNDDNFGTPTGGTTMMTVNLDISGGDVATAYYNLDAAAEDGICQVCHTQNLVYNSWLEPGEVPVHSFIETAGLNRPCQDCHPHKDTNDTSFQVPSIDNSVNTTMPTCEDCHLWNPDGDATHPLMAPWDNLTNGYPNYGLGGRQAQQGGSETDANDDIDNYVFGTQDVAFPTRVYRDRSMIDEAQWLTAGHGVPALSDLPINGSLSVTPGPELGCMTNTPGQADGGCHIESTDHGSTDNPFRLVLINSPALGTKEVIFNLCTADLANGPTCHDPSNSPPVKSKLQFDPVSHADVGNDNMYEEGICTDCHDPHGDSSRMDASLIDVPDTVAADDPTGGINAAMIQREIVWEDRWTSGLFADPTVLSVAYPAEDKLEPVSRFAITGITVAEMSDYVRDSATDSGICEVCHRAGTTQWFRWKNDDAQARPSFHTDSPGSEVSCTNQGTCHVHPNGFDPYEPPDGPCSCYLCHTGVEDQFGYSSVHDITFTPSTSLPFTSYSADCSGVDCLICHDLDTDSNHMLPNQMVYLTDVDAGASPGFGITNSPSVFGEHNNSLTVPMWGDMKAIDPDGEWCLVCHREDTTNAPYKFTPAAEANVINRARFLTTGHGDDVGGVGTNFEGRFPPNDANGRSSCTACHTYHGSNNRAMIKMARWNGAGYDEPYTYPDVDDYVPGTSADSKEVFCLMACHLNTTPSYGGWTNEFLADITADADERGAGMRAHWIFDYAGNIGSTGTYADHSSDTYYFTSKAVGFVMGGTDTASKYVADSVATGEQVVFNESAASINASLPMGDIASDAARALCATCHNVHGSTTDLTWGHTGFLPPSTDDNMLREFKTDKVTPFPDDTAVPPYVYSQCTVCHP
jgi:predicted CxxxxCH...CXXCH cytochrome family protein